MYDYIMVRVIQTPSQTFMYMYNNLLCKIYTHEYKIMLPIFRLFKVLHCLMCLIFIKLSRVQERYYERENLQTFSDNSVPALNKV